MPRNSKLGDDAVTVHIKFPLPTYQILESIALSEDRSVSAITRILLREALQARAVNSQAARDHFQKENSK